MSKKYQSYCNVEGCQKPFLANGYCSQHNQRFKKYGDPLHPIYKAPKCKIDGCDGINDTQGLCGKHAMRLKRYGDVNYITPEKLRRISCRLSQPKLGKLQPKTYAKYLGGHKHRLIMELKLGRKLLRNEIVHHIDGNKHNNNIDNLELITQSEHIKKHLGKEGKLKKCSEIIKQE